MIFVINNTQVVDSKTTADTLAASNRKQLVAYLDNVIGVVYSIEKYLKPVEQSLWFLRKTISAQVLLAIYK